MCTSTTWLHNIQNLRPIVHANSIDTSFVIFFHDWTILIVKTAYFYNLFLSNYFSYLWYPWTCSSFCVNAYTIAILAPLVPLNLIIAITWTTFISKIANLLLLFWALCKYLLIKKLSAGFIQIYHLFVIAKFCREIQIALNTPGFTRADCIVICFYSVIIIFSPTTYLK